MELQKYNQIQLPFCNFSSKGLYIQEDIQFEEWEQIGTFLHSVEGSVQFWIGDWIRFGERRWGEKYKEAIQKTGRSYQSVADCNWVATHVDSSLRKENLSFNHHKEVAKLEPAKQKIYLETAEKENLSVRDLRTKIKREEAPKQAIPKKVNIELYCGDFREKHIESESIDLILTDPPYPKEYLHLWKDLSVLAKKVLKPGGMLIAYSGQNNLPTILNSLSENLEYYWLGTLYHEGGVAQRFEVGMFNRGKPILFFQKPPRNTKHEWIEDVLKSPVADKNHHAWGQNIEPLRTLIKAFTKPGDTVLDPMFGGGATIEAAAKEMRNVIGVEFDEEQFKYVEGRISDAA